MMVINLLVKFTFLVKEAPDIETGKNTKRKTNDKKPQEGKSSAKLLRQCPEQLTDVSDCWLKATLYNEVCFF